MKSITSELVALLLLSAVCSAATAQVPEPASIRGDSPQTRKRLAEAEQKLLGGKPADAIEDLSRILDELGADLVSLDGKHYRPASWFAQEVLAKLPPDAVASYQDQVESPARKLLDAAKRSRDPAPLLVLLDRYFVSRPADEGCLMLGDLLFEQGEFRAAERYWRRLLPGKSDDLAYPGSKLNRALVWARIILAARFQGDFQRAKEELAEFQTAYPNEKGAIAGEEGNLAAILVRRLQSPPVLNRGSNAGLEWPTFGGEPGHSGLVSARFPAEWRSTPAPVRIPRVAIDSAAFAPFPHAQAAPFGHPIVVGDRLFVTNGMHLFEYNLKTERSSMPLELSAPPHQGMSEKPPPPPCPSLTAAGGRLFVRTGPVIFHASSLTAPGDAKKESAIVCYSIPVTPGGGLEERWRVKPPQVEGKPPAIWEGAPLAAGRRIWAAYMRLEGGRAVHGIACYDPADVDAAPERPAWTAEVCDSQLTGAYENRTRQELVTLAGRNIVFCTNTGAVVALDAATGRRAWAFRYQRDHRANPTRSSDPAPAVAAGGRVFVAPADASHVYSLDPETGELLWESAEVRGASILGVAAGKVIVTVAEGAKGMRAFDCTTGSYLRNGWHIGNNVSPGRGHGFVTNEVGVWPSEVDLWKFNPANGDLMLNTFRPGGGSQGHYGSTIYVDGRMIVVTASEIWIYTSDLKEFGPPSQRVSAAEASRLEFNRAVAKAERALNDRQPELARETLLKAARSNLPTPYRAWAAARLVLLARLDGAAAKTERDLAGVLTPELRAEWVIAPDGMLVTLGMLLDGRRDEQPVAARPMLSANEHLVQEKPRISGRVGIDRTVRAPPGSAPLRFINDSIPPRQVYLTTDSRLIAINLSTGKESGYQAVAPFTHVAEIAEGFIAAGPSAVALYDSPGQEQAPRWLFRVPVTNPLPIGAGHFPVYSDLVEAPPELSSFHICGSHLIARLGNHHLLALDLLRRCVAWVRASDGSSGYRAFVLPGVPQFQPEYAANAQFISVQLSSGQRWDIHTDTGNRLRPTLLSWLQALAEPWTTKPERDCPSRPRLGFGEAVARRWESPPVQLDGLRLVEAAGPAQLRLLDLARMRVNWTHGDGKRETSLTGAPPQIRVWGDVLLAAVQRNQGVELDCVSLETGKSLWRGGAIFLDADKVRLADADCDREHLYLSVGGSLVAIDLATGKTSWEANLPDAKGVQGWAVRAGQKCVAAYPLQAISREAAGDVSGRMARSLAREPEPWRLPYAAAGLYDVWTVRTFPVVTFDLESGRQLGKVEIPARGPAVTVCFNRDRAVIAAGEQVSWLK